MGIRFTLAVLLAGCSGQAVVTSSGAVQLEAGTMDFGQAWVGHSSVRPVTLRNEARGDRAAVLTVSAPFVLSSHEVLVPGGSSLTLDLSLTAAAEGRVDGTLTLTTEAGTSQLPVSAIALAPPTCPAPEACRAVTFDPTSGSCVDAALADGTSCSGNACVENGQCQAGVCKGTAQTCDDANACTTDSCGIDGCVHATRACPAPTDPCQVPTCDPINGCATEEAPDGTRCGAGDCVRAQVCMSGACVVRPVPEGAACGAATPCAAAPTCQAQACVASPSVPLAEVWSYAPASDAKVTSFGSQDTQGNFYFLEYAGLSHALVSLTRDGAVRFKVPAGEQNATVVRGPIDVANQQLLLVSRYRTLEARGLSDGKVRWSLDTFEALKPLFDRGPGATYSFSIYETTLVSATTAVLSVHEDAGAWRSWVVGISLVTGKVLWNREHPGHLSSFVSNAKGDVFYIENNGWAGMLTLFALQSDGAQLWSKSLPANVFSSALSLVDGALLLRGMNQWLDAANGACLAALGPIEAGTLSVGDGQMAWLIDTCSGAGCSDTLRAFDVQSRKATVSASAGAGVTELLLASQGVLAITSPRGVYPQPASTLVGLSATGAEAFRCKTPGALDPAAVLDDGRLVGRLGNRIAALSLPGWSPASSGWISARGSPLRTGRAR